MTLAAVDGRLEVTPPGSTVAFLSSGDLGVEVPPGSFVRTRSVDRAAISLPQGGSLRLDHGTVARLDSSVSVSLDDGAVYLSSADGARGGVEVRTALGTVREIGTQFEVRRRGDRLDVMVRDGLVSLERNGEDHRITHGVSLHVDADGGVGTGTVSSYDEAWAWVQEVAPVFEIEGRTVLAFLDWYTGETGLGVRFADPGVERFAAETILHGSIEGVPVATAPEVLLPSCRLDLTREPGSILVRRLELEPPGSSTTPPGG
jgi:transmembrane sensor